MHPLLQGYLLLFLNLASYLHNQQTEEEVRRQDQEDQRDEEQAKLEQAEMKKKDGRSRPDTQGRSAGTTDQQGKDQTERRQAPADVTVEQQRKEPADGTVEQQHRDPADVTVEQQHKEPADGTVEQQHKEPADVTVEQQHKEPDDVTVEQQRREPADVTVEQQHKEPADVRNEQPECVDTRAVRETQAEAQSRQYGTHQKNDGETGQEKGEAMTKLQHVQRRGEPQTTQETRHVDGAGGGDWPEPQQDGEETKPLKEEENDTETIQDSTKPHAETSFKDNEAQEQDGARPYDKTAHQQTCLEVTPPEETGAKAEQDQTSTQTAGLHNREDNVEQEKNINAQTHYKMDSILNDLFDILKQCATVEDELIK